ncbi:MAG: patatin-like phospholipase family protein [Nitrososphaeraceae archaeon]
MSKKDYSDEGRKHKKQRALVLQGGGALGAYEAGVINVLCKRFTEKNDKEKNKDNRRPLFDIVAGTSIGAMNAAVLVSNVVKKGKSWTEAAKELERFWREGIALKEGTAPSKDIVPIEIFRIFPWWKPWTKDVPRWAPCAKQTTLQDDGIIDTSILASEEAARRYYSTKEFVFKGTKVFSIKDIREDKKFLDEGELAKWIVLNDEPLREQLELFGDLPIATSFDKGEPRLLVTAVDIAEGIPVTFDSYKKSDGKRKTQYYPRTKYGYKKHEESKKNNIDENDSKPIIIEYEDGITLEHIMASGTLPELYDPKEICNRRFWDGGLLSNTPLSELLESHRDYWINVEKKDQVPDLEVYIVNVHPSRINAHDMNNSYDFVKDRSNDIVYGDRTYNEQLSTAIMSDFMDFINDLKKQALGHIKHENDKKAFEKDFENLKNKNVDNTSINYRQGRRYEDLIKGVFRLAKVVRIERKYDPNTSTSFKTGDLTPKTINELIEEGEKDSEFI